jgi:hypothetical protein
MFADQKIKGGEKNMRKIGIAGLCLAVVTLFVAASTVTAAPHWDKNPKAFEHGLAVEIEGNEYYFKGPGSVMGVIDVPGHTWVQSGPTHVEGKHYNVGPWFAPANAPWWATGEPYGVLLYQVKGIIDVPPEDLTDKEEQWYKKHGYVHVHEFVDGNGIELEDYVVYLKHTAVQEFYFNGGPMAPLSNHQVSPGIDYNFIPNW